MTIVLDTNVVSELMRPQPHPAVTTWLQSQPAATLTTTSITVAEVLYGLHRLPAGRRRDQLLSSAERVFGTFQSAVLAFDTEAAGAYAELVAAREAAGSPINGFDAQIAAICRVRHARLATRNTTDFGDLGLSLVDPWTEG